MQFEGKVQRREGEEGEEIKKGDVVTFEYDSYKKREGKPTNARIIKQRPDLTWFNVVFNFAQGEHRRSLNSIHFSFSHSLLLLCCLFIFYILLSFFSFSFLFHLF